jgi:ATP/maltotriose-dependent transcriptional regulator MalT/DNA-binding SARP family transcriptional activator
MSDPLRQLKKILPANKFRPPLIDSSRQVFREALILELMGGKWAKKRNILIEAPAGQGKTTLAVQLRNRTSSPCPWYLAGNEDCDPIFFLSSLYLFFHESFPGFAIPDLEERILLGAIASDEAPEMGPRLLMAVSAFFPSDYFLVFDDLHCLDPSLLSCSLLTKLVCAPVERVRFLLISRHKVPILSETLLRDRATLRLTGQDLALTRREVFDLAAKVSAVPLLRNEVAEIHEITEGWVMGILLLLKSRIPSWASSRELQSGETNAALIAFFVKDLLATFPPQARKALFMLAQLEEIPLELAEFLGARTSVEVRAILEGMVEKNLFVQFLAAREETASNAGAFRFHQLFRETLRRIALEEFDKKTINRFARMAAEWFLSRGNPLLGLHYFLTAEDYEGAQEVARECGIRLLSQGLHITIHQLLGRLSPELMKQYPWLSLVYGIALMEIDPLSAYPYLESAGEQLGKKKDPAGELYALAQRVTFHLAVDARYGEGSRLLPRTEELFRQLEAELNPFACMQIAFALGLGYCFFDCDLAAARRYMERSMKLAQEHGSLKYQASNRMLGGFINLFAGSTQGCIDEIEKSFGMLSSPLVSQFFKLYLVLFQINFLALTGDFSNYAELKASFRRFLGNHLIANSVADPFLLLWDIDRAVSEGRFDEARSLVTKALKTESAAVSKHFSCQYLQYGAYLTATAGGDRDAVLEWAQLSADHRRIAGGRYYAALNEMFLGAIFSFVDEPEQAERHLTRAEEEFRAMDNPWMLAAVLFHRAHHRLQGERREAGMADLKEGLTLMRRHQYRNFYGWDPRIMETLLKTGVAAGIEEEYGRWLASNRLHRILQGDGTSLPILFIRALGPLEITFGRGPVIAAADLSEIQRRLLAIAMISPGQQVSQESLQEQLWPECGPERGRKRFDTVLFRMRKMLDERLGSLPIQHYIQLQAGILCLKNCRIDTVDFMETAQRGQGHFLKREMWQAGVAFRTARALWRGRFMGTTRLEGREDTYRQELLDTYLDICCKWAETCFRAGFQLDAETIAWNALKEDPTSEPLVQILYNCYVSQGAPVKAAQLLKRYEEALRKEDYLVEEIDEIMEKFWRSP